MAIGDGYELNYKSFVAVSKETTWGTFVTATACLEFNTESIARNIPGQMLTAVNSQREVHKRILGNETVSGALDVDLNIANDAVVNIIKQAMGGTVTSTPITTGAYTHVLTTGDMEANAGTSTSTDMRGLSMVVRRGGTYSWCFQGMRVNSLTIKGEIGKPIMMTADFVGQTGSISSALVITPVYPDTIPLIWTGVTVSHADSIGAIAGATARTYQSFEVKLDNKLQTDSRQLGSRQITALPVGGQEVSLKLTQRFDTTTSNANWLAETPEAIRILMTSSQTIGGLANTTTYSMYIDLPRCMLDYKNPTVGGRDGALSHELNFMCLRDNTTTSYAIKAEICNATASYY